jgi:YHS domain-containing protein
VTPEKANGSFVDWRGIRYYFVSDANAHAFMDAPEMYVAVPAKETLVCSVDSKHVDNYSTAYAYHDHNGTRYFLCGPTCVSAFSNDPGKYVTTVTTYVVEPAARQIKLK